MPEHIISPETLESLAQAQKVECLCYLTHEEFSALLETDHAAEYASVRRFQGSGLNLKYRNFHHASITVSHFTDCQMRHTAFGEAALSYTTFTNCDLDEADFAKADLSEVDFRNCNLEGCYFGGAFAMAVRGLKTISPVGSKGRLIYAYVYDGDLRIQAGCRNGTADEIRAAVKLNYDDDPVGRRDYLGAIKYLEAWGKDEKRRLKQLAKDAE